jgi:translation initiation factor IF-1
MAKQQACTGGQGAALVTETGPVEVYRMQCDNGKVFMARCELRQCRKM